MEVAVQEKQPRAARDHRNLALAQAEGARDEQEQRSAHGRDDLQIDKSLPC